MDSNGQSQSSKSSLTLPHISWPGLCAICPALEMLARRAARRHRHDWRLYERLKAELQRYVGWFAADTRLRSEAAYELAHAHILGGRIR